MTLDVHHPSRADVDPLGEGLSARRCRERASECDKSQQFHYDVFDGGQTNAPPRRIMKFHELSLALAASHQTAAKAGVALMKVTPSHWVAPGLTIAPNVRCITAEICDRRNGVRGACCMATTLKPLMSAMCQKRTFSPFTSCTVSLLTTDRP